MASVDPDHWFVVDGRATPDEVAAMIDARLDAVDW
jgi:hypothetical protein